MLRQNPERRSASAFGSAALLLLLMLFAAACGRMQRTAPAADDGYSVTMTSEPSPPSVGQGTLTFTLRDPAGQPVSGADLTVVGNMSHAGMVPVTGVPESPSGDAYRVSMNWTMSGDWFVDVTFKIPDGKEVARRLPISVQ